MAIFFDSSDKISDTMREPEKARSSIVFDEYRYFKRRLHEEVLRSQRCRHPFTLMRIAINPPNEESTNHSVQIADALKSSIREYDLLCTVKPAEYVIAFPETNELYAERIAGRIREMLSNRTCDDEVSNPLQSWIGIACFPHDGTDAEDLIQSAEQDLCQTRKKRN